MNSSSPNQNKLFLMVGISVLFLLVLAACGGGGDTLSEGDQAPAFTLQSTQGEEVSLSDYTGEEPVLLYFSMADG